MITDSVKITSKGQLTLPKKIRDILKSDIVAFEVHDDMVTIRPIKNVRGRLKKYLKKSLPFDKVREQAWRKALNERKI